jgi:hypothetical protein
MALQATWVMVPEAAARMMVWRGAAMSVPWCMRPARMP